MTAGELIAYLSAINPDTEVGFNSPVSGFVSFAGVQEYMGKLAIYHQSYGSSDKETFVNNVAAIWKLQQLQQHE